MFFSEQIFLNSIEEQLTKIVDAVSDIILKEWVKGGHALTGEFEDTLRNEVKIIGTKVVANIWLAEYYIFVNEGVEADRIPFEPGSGAGESAYIQGLVTYFQLRSHLSEKEALKAAFATANKHSQVGMPIDKDQLGFFTSALYQSEPIIDEGIAEIGGSALNSVIDMYQSELVGKIKIVL